MPDLNKLYTIMQGDEEFRNGFIDLVKTMIKTFCKKPLRASYKPPTQS